MERRGCVWGSASICISLGFDLHVPECVTVRRRGSCNCECARANPHVHITRLARMCWDWAVCKFRMYLDLCLSGTGPVAGHPFLPTVSWFTCCSYRSDAAPGQATINLARCVAMGPVGGMQRGVKMHQGTC